MFHHHEPIVIWSQSKESKHFIKRQDKKHGEHSINEKHFSSFDENIQFKIQVIIYCLH